MMMMMTTKKTTQAAALVAQAARIVNLISLCQLSVMHLGRREVRQCQTLGISAVRRAAEEATRRIRRYTKIG